MRRNILRVVSGPAVAKMRSVRSAFCLKNRGFCRVRLRDGVRACFCKLLCRDNNSPPCCSRPASGSPGSRSPGGSSGSLAGAPTGPRRLSGPAAWACRDWPRAPAPFPVGCLSLCCRRQPWRPRLVRSLRSGPAATFPLGQSTLLHSVHAKLPGLRTGPPPRLSTVD